MLVEAPLPPAIDYGGADAAAKARMESIMRLVDSAPGDAGFIESFGEKELNRFRESLKAIATFLDDPTSPEAGRHAKDRLRLEHAEASEGLGLALGAGGEALRRYDAQYIPEAQRMFAGSGDASDRQYLADVAGRRGELESRVRKIGIPPLVSHFVRNAIQNLESSRELAASISKGLPLEEAITIRKSPLRLLRQSGPGQP